MITCSTAQNKSWKQQKKGWGEFEAYQGNEQREKCKSSRQKTVPWTTWLLLLSPLKTIPYPEMCSQGNEDLSLSHWNKISFLFRQTRACQMYASQTRNTMDSPLLRNTKHLNVDLICKMKVSWGGGEWRKGKRKTKPSIFIWTPALLLNFALLLYL